jgi:predicted kinase
MNRKPKCIIVTGRQGSGKSTLAAKLARALWMPLVSRDEIKEGYVNTFGIRHDELPPETNRVVTDLFFRLVDQYLLGEVSIVIEAAFQHKVWEYTMPRLLELADVRIVLCTVGTQLAAQRSLQRGLDHPDREFYHGDNRVVHYKRTGELLTPADYEPPDLDVPTIEVSTDGNYSPSIDEIMKQIRLSATIDGNEQMSAESNRGEHSMDSLSRLEEIGFSRVGNWKLASNGITFEGDEDLPASNVLYAFVSDREVLYVGKTVRGLKNRLRGYERPDPSQRTNHKCNEKVYSTLKNRRHVNVFARAAQNPEWRIGSFTLNEAAALEDAIIRELKPPWNNVGK